MTENSVLLYYYDEQGTAKVETFSVPLINHTLSNDDEFKVRVLKGGIAEYITVTLGAELFVEEGGSASHVTIDLLQGEIPTPYLDVKGGVVSDLIVRGIANAYYSSEFDDVQVSGNGGMYLYYGSYANGVLLEDNAYFSLHLQSYAANITVEGGTMQLDGASFASKITVKDGGSLGILGSSTVHDVKLQSGATCALRSGSVIARDFHIASGVSFVAETNTVLEFDLNQTSPGGTLFIEDYTCISGTPYYLAVVSEKQAVGNYALMGNASSFASSLYFACGDYAPMSLDVGCVGTYHNSTYTLTLKEGDLSVNAADYVTTGSAKALAWSNINGAESYALELACGTQTIALNMKSENAELLGLGNGSYTWQVRNTTEADNWQTGKAFTQTEAKEGPQELVATGTDSTAIFFAKTDGVWNNGYAARNMLTGETVQLAGKTKITDIFTGNDQASILLLDAFASGTQQVPEAQASGDFSCSVPEAPASGDFSCSVPEAPASGAASGIALFLDDIYSAAPSSSVPEAPASGNFSCSVSEAPASGRRLSNIDTIIASKGDDIIDLTSDRYALAGNVTILGGDGDDILWANEGNDILSGGAGNDTLHGGGGSDIFCFGEGWGEDTVGQLAGGKVVLWFAEGDENKWDAATLTYADGANKVIVSGVGASAIELRFGATGHELEYTTLAAAGVFA